MIIVGDEVSAYDTNHAPNIVHTGNERMTIRLPATKIVRGTGNQNAFNNQLMTARLFNVVIFGD